MKIAITGASGFIGKSLTEFFLSKGYLVLPVTRDLLRDCREKDLCDLLAQTDVVINLAGATINKRWTVAYKKELFKSRINTTRKVVDIINTLEHKPKVLISASAVGYYDDINIHTEVSNCKGNSFLSDLCEQWETEAQKVSDEVRLAICRFGVVLSKNGGAFSNLSFPTKLGIIPIIGDGGQAFPWIALADLISAISFIVENDRARGAFNFTAPEQLNYKAVMFRIGKYYKGFLSFKVPQFVMSLIMGEFGISLTKGQNVVPLKLDELGFTYKYPTLTDFLED